MINNDAYSRGYPNNASVRLTALIESLCPAHGVGIGRWDDRTTWRLDAKPEATEDEIAAALAALASFDPWGEGDDLGAMDAPPEEDDDEPFTEFTEEEFAPVAEEDEAGEDAGEDAGQIDDTPAAPAPDTEGLQGVVNPDAGAADSLSYPGIAILPDELGARRNAVLAAITTEKLTRLSIAMDPSRADFLAGEATRYWNWPKDVPFPPELERNYADFCMHRDWREKIIAFALSLEASALTADMIQLENMARDLGSGWPT